MGRFMDVWVDVKWVGLVMYGWIYGFMDGLLDGFMGRSMGG